MTLDAVTTYAVGDIHGCRGLLVELLRRIEVHAAGRAHRLVFLGDYVDRGPDSAGVLVTLRELQARKPGQVVCLKGNHEDMLLRAVQDARAEPQWLANGGKAALRSFGVADPRTIPADVVAWLQGCPTVFDDGLRVFVHAGLDPARPLADQSDADRLWIRDPFLSAEHDFGRYVVHGHTPCSSGLPDVRRRRVNLDTAAVFGGRLTAGLFGDARPEPLGFLSVPAGYGG